MIIPLWRERIVILLFAEWWKGRNKIQSPDSTVEKLFLSLFFSCMYILLLFSLLSLSFSFFAFIVFTRTFSATTLRNIAFSQTQSDFVPFSFRGNIEFPLPSALSHLEIESPRWWSLLAQFISASLEWKRHSPCTAPPPPPSWQLYNEISRVGPLDRFLPRKRLIRLRRSREKIVDKNDIPLSGRLLRAFTLLSSPSRGEGNVKNDRKNRKERLNRDLVR